MTLAGTPLLFLALDELTFHLETPQVGQQDEFFSSFLYNMQSFGHACIFSYSIPNVFKVFFASYMDSDNSLLRGNISLGNPNSNEKPLSDHPNRAFRLYNLTHVDSLVNFLQPGYKGFSASCSNFLKISASA